MVKVQSKINTSQKRNKPYFLNSFIYAIGYNANVRYCSKNQIVLTIYLLMITIEEQKFIAYWSKKREESKLNPFFFVKGFTVGLVFSILVLICLGADWYKRATMDANTKLNPIVLFVALLLITLFLAIFYNSFKYEQNEQLFKELKHKDKSSNS